MEVNEDQSRGDIRTLIKIYGYFDDNGLGLKRLYSWVRYLHCSGNLGSFTGTTYGL